MFVDGCGEAVTVLVGFEAAVLDVMAAPCTTAPWDCGVEPAELALPDSVIAELVAVIIVPLEACEAVATYDELRLRKRAASCGLLFRLAGIRSFDGQLPAEHALDELQIEN